MPSKKPASSTPIDAFRHLKDKRPNNPTQELRGFMKKDEEIPETLFLARDPSLDPQLVWRTKDEKDTDALAVPVVPIYTQEKIHPQAIIEQVRAEVKKETPAQAKLYADFNGIKFEEYVNFYRYKQNWSNRMILGNSLLVMASLAGKENLRGKVQMIYLDPPYGIKFGSNWQVSTRRRDVKDGRAEDTTRQPEQIRAFRDTWKLGIHSYLSYLRDRLFAAHELLTETGSIFVQISDDNVHLVRCLMDEVFGSENFITEIVFQKTGSQSGDFLQSTNDYLCWYAKDREAAKNKFRQLYQPRDEREESEYSPDPLTSAGATQGSTFTFNLEGKDFHPGNGAHWKTTREGMERLRLANRIAKQKDQIRFKRFWADFPVKPFSNLWAGLGGASDMIYAVQTNVKVVERCILMTTDPGDLVLDPTCGSGTTAYVAEQWGRRWITVDHSRVALALARTRLMAAKYPSYVLADSPEGVKRQAELMGHTPSAVASTENDIHKGFVYRRVPHITLKAIANDEEISNIYARWQEKLEPVRKELNKLLEQSWEEWQIPHKARSEWPEKARRAYVKWWEMQRERQKEIDAEILHGADDVFLYDQPYEDTKRLRVTGPFTVDSLSPHRVLSGEADRPISEIEAQKQSTGGQFETTIIDYLKRAGVQNTKAKERLVFDRLEPYAGTCLHAEGEYTENGVSRRVAVCIGPEYDTVGADLVKDAAIEAVRGIGFDLLVICGFAFDAYVSEEIKQYGRLVILPTKMSYDLTMGDDHLKKTGVGNLFMVFGEPDVELRKQENSRFVVEIKGVDIYDPTTGEIRNSSVDDIACWFIDTDYNGESFFVRHAYFTGADDPYNKLRRALRADINEEAWSSLYTTVSRPFDVPKTGKIGIKVINHYGDEVLKVYDLKAGGKQ